MQRFALHNFVHALQLILLQFSSTTAMDRQQNQKHTKEIYRMLSELAAGQLEYRIALDAAGSPFTEIALLLNELAQKMQQAGCLHPGNDFSRPVAADRDPAIAMVQKVQEYIVSHIEEPLPSAKELASMLETNEFTLKDNFRKHLHTSIYQCYNEERLKKAYSLIEKTRIPLKEIAFLCGFNDYTNFFKAFRKKYKCNPSGLVRNIQDNDA